jgi:hypothetical protein
VLCTLPPYLSKHLLSVTPVVAQVPPAWRPVPNPSEVGAVFHVPLEAFLAGKDHLHWDVSTDRWGGGGVGGWGGKLPGWVGGWWVRELAA